MVKKTIIAIMAVVLLATIAATAYNYGMTRYGTFYYDSPYYSYYQYYKPYQYYYQTGPSYAYPYYATPGPLSSDYMYRYGYYQSPYTQVRPEVAYPASVYTARGVEGQLCGQVNGGQFGCSYGLVCDYTKAEQQGIGVCSRQATY